MVSNGNTSTHHFCVTLPYTTSTHHLIDTNLQPANHYLTNN